MKPVAPSLTTRSEVSPALRREKGSALIVGLILLLVITLLAITGMRNTIMQERMAGNMYDRNLAFQASEGALRAGEQWLETNNLTTLEGADPLVALVASNDLQQWDGSDATGTGPDLDPSTELSLARDPVFHIGPPQRKRVGIELPPEWEVSYTVSSYAEGGTDTSVVILQSGYQPLP